ncbi:MAG: UbiD family decarboxylase [Candidatus Thermoplasmatota archaeon]|nr:UbiD family decarboxylase [Candidatus Thermoplasmatota archaeon]
MSKIEFRALLEGTGAVHMEKAVDRCLEASSLSREDQRRTWVAQDRANSSFRLAGNVYSNRDRIASILGVERDKVPRLILSAMEGPVPPQDISIPGLYRTVEPDDLPIPTYYEGDGGPYITSGIFHAVRKGRGNLSFHRMMYLGGGRFAIRVVPRHLRALMDEALSSGQELRVCVSIGCDIASLISASCSARYGMDEFEIASSLHRSATGEPLRTIYEDGLRAPEGSEIILYGRIGKETASEGPFVDITGTVDNTGMEGQPVFTVDTAYAREDPIMHVLLPGGLEHYLLMGLPKEPAILSSVSKVVPKVHAVRLTEGGCCWLHGIVSITSQKSGDGKNAAMAAFTGHPSMKRVMIVDDDIDIFDDEEVEWALATRFQAGRDLVVVEGARGSTLDPSLAEDGTTSKMGIDATMPFGDRSGFRRVKV